MIIYPLGNFQHLADNRDTAGLVDFYLYDNGIVGQNKFICRIIRNNIPMAKVYLFVELHEKLTVRELYITD